MNNIESLKARVASLEQCLVKKTDSLQAARVETLAAHERTKRLITQREVAWAAARRRAQAANFQETALREIITALEVRAHKAEAEAAEWETRHQRIRARIWRVLSLSGAPLFIRMIPRPMRGFIKTTLLARTRH